MNFLRHRNSTYPFSSSDSLKVQSDKSQVRKYDPHEDIVGESLYESPCTQDKCLNVCHIPKVSTLDKKSG
jgi:hypothetical protein